MTSAIKKILRTAEPVLVVQYAEDDNAILKFYNPTDLKEKYYLSFLEAHDRLFIAEEKAKTVGQQRAILDKEEAEFLLKLVSLESPEAQLKFRKEWLEQFTPRLQASFEERRKVQLEHNEAVKALLSSACQTDLDELGLSMGQLDQFLTALMEAYKQGDPEDNAMVKQEGK